MQELVIVRGCKGQDVAGGNLVEVAPSFGTTGTTSLTGTTLLYKILCALPG